MSLVEHDQGLVEARRRLAERLRSRREEIERTLATRIHAIAPPSEIDDPEYLDGLRLALATAVDFGLAAIERGEGRAPQLPAALLAQARMAARNGVDLETVLRRYLAGHSLLVELILEEAEAAPVAPGSLGRVLQGHAAVFDRLIEAVSEEYRRESGGLVRSRAERRAERVRRLLAGEPIDAAELAYELDCFHLGLVGRGPGVLAMMRDLAHAADASLLAVERPDSRAWGWLGSRHPFQRTLLGRIFKHAASARSTGATLALGEPAAGLSGWRLTHRQALTALPMAHRLGRNVIRYADIGLLASVNADDLLLESLRQMFVTPLAEERDGGVALRETLRAYLSAGRNISSAAARLGVDRGTVRKRVRAAEELIGRSIDDCSAELEIALRLGEGAASRERFRRPQIGGLNGGEPSLW